MNKLELLELLQNVPDDMDIFITQSNTEFGLSLLESAKVEEATFSEGTEHGPKAKEKVLILSDDYTR